MARAAMCRWLQASNAVLQFVDLTEGGHQSYKKWSNDFTCLLRCTSPKVALFGPRAMSDLSPECALKRTTANAVDLWARRTGLAISSTPKSIRSKISSSLSKKTIKAASSA